MRVLITGATGFVGSALTELLLKQNIEVNYLTTSKQKIVSELNYKGFYWDPDKFEIDSNCISEVDYIFNFSGKSISCRWNSKNKQAILQSRINSSKTLFKLLSENKNCVKKVISASAIGIYKNSFTELYSEDSSEFNSDFLGKVCQEWETENKKFNQLNVETLIVRFGLVLSESEGALPQFVKTMKFYVGSLLGSGKQWYSWIHINDLVEILYFGMNHNIFGIINGVAPNPKIQSDFLKELSIVLKRPMWLPRVPTFILRLVLGEMHHLVTDSQKVSAEKIEKLGYKFKFQNVNEAFLNLYKK